MTRPGQVLQRPSSPRLEMSRVNFFVPSFVSRGRLQIIDVNGGENVLLHDASLMKDGVSKFKTVPGHERAKHIPAQRQFPALRGRGRPR